MAALFSLLEGRVTPSPRRLLTHVACGRIAGVGLAGFQTLTSLRGAVPSKESTKMLKFWVMFSVLHFLSGFFTCVVEVAAAPPKTASFPVFLHGRAC